MRYYIYSGTNLTEVSESVYSEWVLCDKYNYSLEDYLHQTDNESFSIQVAYFGVFGDHEIPKPFVLSYTRVIKANGKTKEENLIEYYETHEAVAFRRTELINQITNKLLHGTLN